MNFDDLDGARLTQAAAQAGAAAPGPEREPLYQALLSEPLVALLADEGAPPAVGLKLPGLPAGTRLRLSPSPSSLTGLMGLGGPVAQLFATGTLARRESERERQAQGSDAALRVHGFAPGEVFPLLRTHPGAIIATDSATVVLDAGEVAALGEGLAPHVAANTIRELVRTGRGGEAARRIAERLLYVLGHPNGGMVSFQHELPAFFHLASAARLAERMAEQLGRRPEQALVAARELFRVAVRGKLTLLVEPGRAPLRLNAFALQAALR